MLRLFDTISYRAEGDTGQNGDDPNDHEEFNEGETASIGSSGTNEAVTRNLHSKKTIPAEPKRQ